MPAIAPFVSLPTTATNCTPAVLLLCLFVPCLVYHNGHYDAVYHNGNHWGRKLMAADSVDKADKADSAQHGGWGNYGGWGGHGGGYGGYGGGGHVDYRELLLLLLQAP